MFLKKPHPVIVFIAESKIKVARIWNTLEFSVHNVAMHLLKIILLYSAGAFNLYSCVIVSLSKFIFLANATSMHVFLLIGY